MKGVTLETRFKMFYQHDRVPSTFRSTYMYQCYGNGFSWSNRLTTEISGPNCISENKSVACKYEVKLKYTREAVTSSLVREINKTVYLVCVCFTEIILTMRNHILYVLII